MPSHLHRRAFRFPELIVVLPVLSALVSRGIVALRSARENSRRNTCPNKLREIRTAFRNYDSHFQRFPSACEYCAVTRPLPNRARDCRPGDASGGTSTTGCSFLAFVLPVLEETDLYIAISQGTQRFTITTGPFR